MPNKNMIRITCDVVNYGSEPNNPFSLDRVTAYTGLEKRRTAPNSAARELGACECDGIDRRSLIHES